MRKMASMKMEPVIRSGTSGPVTVTMGNMALRSTWRLSTVRGASPLAFAVRT